MFIEKEEGKEIMNQLTPEEAIREMTQLKRRLTSIEKSLSKQKQKMMINVTKDININPCLWGGVISRIDLLHKCWVISSTPIKDFPREIKVQNSHYKIEWVKGDFRILWDGKWGD